MFHVKHHPLHNNR